MQFLDPQQQGCLQDDHALFVQHSDLPPNHRSLFWLVHNLAEHAKAAIISVYHKCLKERNERPHRCYQGSVDWVCSMLLCCDITSYHSPTILVPSINHLKKRNFPATNQIIEWFHCKQLFCLISQRIHLILLKLTVLDKRFWQLLLNCHRSKSNSWREKAHYWNVESSNTRRTEQMVR